MKKIFVLLFLACFALILISCTTTGKLLKVVGGAYNGAGNVLVERGEEKKTEEKAEKAEKEEAAAKQATEDQAKQVAVEPAQSAVKPATKKPAAKKPIKKPVSVAEKEDK